MDENKKKNLIKNLTIEGWTMAKEVNLKGVEREYFAKGFVMGGIYTQTDTSNYYYSIL